MTTVVPLADARKDMSALVSEVESTHERVVITKHGRPSAVLISYQDLESMEETLEVLSDPELVAGIREALASPERFSLDDIRGDLAKRADA